MSRIFDEAFTGRNKYKDVKTLQCVSQEPAELLLDDDTHFSGREMDAHHARCTNMYHDRGIRKQVFEYPWLARNGGTYL